MKQFFNNVCLGITGNLVIVWLFEIANPHPTTVQVVLATIAVIAFPIYVNTREANS